MIAKGTPHRDGSILARYLVTAKDRERAELWQLRGFALENIVDAFRSVHVMAEGTRCKAPFFHVYIRNREGESLDREQWERTADRIERVLGLNDQPRAIAFHTAEDTGDCHMHIAWSRIDQDTLTAKPLPFFQYRLKRASREIEELFDLPPVLNQRESPIRFAPKRAEEQQARRLGLNVHDTREVISDCFERSDCGQSFKAALGAHDLLLARGDSRDFLVVDGKGGMHALGKRILGVPAAEIRHRLADLGRDHLPTLEQAREFIAAKRQVSLANKPDDVCIHAKDQPKPVDDRKRTRHGGNENTRRAAGKKQPRDQVRKQLATAQSVVPLDHPATNSRAPCGSPVSEGAPIDQLRSETPEPPPNAAQCADPPRAITRPGQQTQVASSRDEAAGPEAVAGALSQFEQAPPVHRTPGHAARLRDQFRALCKQLTVKALAPQPTARKRRREEIGGGFRKAALSLRRSVARIPPLHFLDPTWEPFTWLRLWEYNNPPTTDLHQEHGAPTFSNQSLHL
jgi:hypothetical protein